MVIVTKEDLRRSFVERKVDGDDAGCEWEAFLLCIRLTLPLVREDWRASAACKIGN